MCGLLKTDMYCIHNAISTDIMPCMPHMTGEDSSGVDRLQVIIFHNCTVFGLHEVAAEEFSRV